MLPTAPNLLRRHTMSTPNPWTQHMPSRKAPPIGPILLILFVLPGLLATFDRLVTRKGQRHPDA